MFFDGDHKGDMFFIENSSKIAGKWGIIIERVVEPDRFIVDGDILKVGPLELKIIETPGHSPGGISIFIKSESALFSGDTLFFRSIGRTDFDYGSMSKLQDSIRNKLYKLPDETTVYTGHGEPTTIGDEKRSNMFIPE